METPNEPLGKSDATTTITDFSASEYAVGVFLGKRA